MEQCRGFMNDLPLVVFIYASQKLDVRNLTMFQSTTIRPVTNDEKSARALRCVESPRIEDSINPLVGGQASNRDKSWFTSGPI
jgi:hypothetical protein